MSIFMFCFALVLIWIVAKSLVDFVGWVFNAIFATITFFFNLLVLLFTKKKS